MVGFEWDPVLSNEHLTLFLNSSRTVQPNACLLFAGPGGPGIMAEQCYRQEVGINLCGDLACWIMEF